MSTIEIEMARELLLRQARKTLADNRECYVAQWILQNPDKDIKEYAMYEQSNWAEGEHTYWLERRDKVVDGFYQWG